MAKAVPLVSPSDGFVFISFLFLPQKYRIIFKFQKQKRRFFADFEKLSDNSPLKILSKIVQSFQLSENFVENRVKFSLAKTGANRKEGRNHGLFRLPRRKMIRNFRFIFLKFVSCGITARP